MALWDFVKDAGQNLLGKAEAAEAKPTEEQLTQAKVDALKAELKRLGLDGNDVHLKLKGDKVTVTSKGADRATVEKLILAIGNIKGIAQVEADLPEPEAAAGAKPEAAPARKDDSGNPVFHTVQAGESLSAIAAKYLGSASKYHAIFEANRPMLSDPDKIYPGQTLRIPDAG